MKCSLTVLYVLCFLISLCSCCLPSTLPSSSLRLAHHLDVFCVCLTTIETVLVLLPAHMISVQWLWNCEFNMLLCIFGYMSDSLKLPLSHPPQPIETRWFQLLLSSLGVFPQGSSNIKITGIVCASGKSSSVIQRADSPGAYDSQTLDWTERVNG